MPTAERGSDLSRTRRTVALLLTAAAALIIVPFTGAPLRAQPAPVDTTDLGTGPYARMHMLLEKTLFKVDVLTLDVRFGPRETTRIEALLGGGKGTAGVLLRDSVASVALDARDVWALIEFQRNVRLDQFLDGISDNLRQATKAGVITVQSYRSISTDLPRWYAFLEQRGIHKGDRMYYRIHNDSLRTVYLDSDGGTLLDQVDVGPERRLSVLGGYFAPGSLFRDKLIDSLLSGL